MRKHLIRSYLLLDRSQTNKAAIYLRMSNPFHMQSLTPFRRLRSNLPRDQFLQRLLRPWPVMADHFGGADGAEARSLPKVAFLAKAEQKPSREKIAGAGGIDHFRDRLGWDLDRIPARRDNGAFFAAGGDRDFAMFAGFGNSSPRTSPPIIDITGPVAGACAKTDAQAIRPKQSPTKKVYSCFVIASSRDKFVTSSVSGSEPLHGPNSLSRHNCSCPSYKPWLKCARGPGPESSRF